MTNEVKNQAQLETELAMIEETIAAQKKQRGILADEQLTIILTALQEKKAAIQSQLSGSGQIIQGDQPIGVQQGEQGQVAIHSQIKGDMLATAATKSIGGDAITGEQVIIVKGDATFVSDTEAPVKITTVERESALGRYLQYIISRNRYLQLQGIRSGGRLVHIELDRIYVTLRATREHIIGVEEEWLATEARLAPGEAQRQHEKLSHKSEPAIVSVNEALQEQRRLVVLGDPGSGKTTLLRYLALLYAQDLAENSSHVSQKLGLSESGYLPILFPLRQIGAFLKAQAQDGIEGHDLLLEFLRRSLRSDRIKVSDDFFDVALKQGKAIILLDGMDEVANVDLRRRVARLIETFTQTYPTCRYVITSRIVGYSGSARLSEAYRTTTVRDFNLIDVEHFLLNWHRLVALGQMGTGPSVDDYAQKQTQHLLDAIRGNDRIRELAINPLLLTVIAMVHRDRVKLPDRRAELYTEAVDVLLGKWEEAKGLSEIPILADKPFDTGDKRLMLQNLALYMQEKEIKEIDVAELRRWLGKQFYESIPNWPEVARIIDRFLQVIEGRTGLLTARGEGVYAFSHLTFQEYLAALAVVGRDDYVAYTLKQVPNNWWREVILLEAGYLSSQGQERTSRLIQAIVELKEEVAPYHNLVLAAECVRDVGASRVKSGLEQEIQQRLRVDIELDPQQEIQSRSGWKNLWGAIQFNEKAIVKELIERKSIAIQALVRSGAGYWSLPYGEPEWVDIAAGPFWMGEGEACRQLETEAYKIAKVPVTEAQYQLFVKATNYSPPSHWEDGQPPKGKESHPVVRVSWDDAQAYSQWLSQVTYQEIRLPSEKEWEKAARGNKDKRAYPWGMKFDALKCNTLELKLGDTTPVGVFQNGASPYNCLDMSGNVLEWCLDWYDEKEQTFRVLRGGSFNVDGDFVRCSFRSGSPPGGSYYFIGFRVVLVSPISKSS